MDQVFIMNRHRDVMMCPALAVILLQFVDHYLCPVAGSSKPRGLSWITVGDENRPHWGEYVWHGGEPSKILGSKTHTMDFKRGQDIEAASRHIRMYLAHLGRYIII